MKSPIKRPSGFIAHLAQFRISMAKIVGPAEHEQEIARIHPTRSKDKFFVRIIVRAGMLFRNARPAYTVIPFFCFGQAAANGGINIFGAVGSGAFRDRIAEKINDERFHKIILPQTMSHFVSDYSLFPSRKADTTKNRTHKEFGT